MLPNSYLEHSCPVTWSIANVRSIQDPSCLLATPLKKSHNANKKALSYCQGLLPFTWLVKAVSKIIIIDTYLWGKYTSMPASSRAFLICSKPLSQVFSMTAMRTASTPYIDSADRQITMNRINGCPWHPNIPDTAWIKQFATSFTTPMPAFRGQQWLETVVAWSMNGCGFLDVQISNEILRLLTWFKHLISVYGLAFMTDAAVTYNRKRWSCSKS